MTSFLIKIFHRVHRGARGPVNISPLPAIRTVSNGNVTVMLHATSFSVEKAYINSTEISMLLDISPSSVRDHASGRRSPQLPSMNCKGQWFFHERDLPVWMAYFHSEITVGAASGFTAAA